MNKLLTALPFLALAAFGSAACAADGEAVFNAQCAMCHAKGGNLMGAGKSLSKADLEKNGVNTKEAIAGLVAKGKAPMPGFEGKLSADEISAVTAYVLEHAEKGW